MDTETLKRLHGVQLEILDEIIRICKEHGITYFLAGGSVLGAIRHQGIIPWDDDIDVMMPRRDFETFAEVCKTELADLYFYQSSETDSHYHHIFAKVRKHGTEFIEANVGDIGQHNGIFVDIFPIDEATALQGKQRMQAVWANKLELLMRVKDHLAKGSWSDRLIVKILSFSLLRKLQRFVLTLGNNKGGEYYVNFGSQYGVNRQTMHQCIYEPAVEVEFEGRMCCVPGNYDVFLRKLYGDNYMQLPEEHKRITHNPTRISFHRHD